jgi:hypothetical protein
MMASPASDLGGRITDSFRLRLYRGHNKSTDHLGPGERVGLCVLVDDIDELLLQPYSYRNTIVDRDGPSS